MTISTGAPRWMKLTLTLSLAANLAVLGLAVGLALRGPIARNGGDSMMELARALPRENQRAMREAMRDAGEGLRASIRHQRGLGTALAETLRATPFDIAAFNAVLAGQRARMGEIQSNVHAALAEQIAAMSDEQRTAFADALEARQQRD